MEWLAGPPVYGTVWRVLALLDLAQLGRALSRWVEGADGGVISVWEELARESEAWGVAGASGSGSCSAGGSACLGPRRGSGGESYRSGLRGDEGIGGGIPVAGGLLVWASAASAQAVPSEGVG